MFIGNVEETLNDADCLLVLVGELGVFLVAPRFAEPAERCVYRTNAAAQRFTESSKLAGKAFKVFGVSDSLR